MFAGCQHLDYGTTVLCVALRHMVYHGVILEPICSTYHVIHRCLCSYELQLLIACMEVIGFNDSECLVKLSVFITWKVVQPATNDGRCYYTVFWEKSTIYLIYFPFGLLSSEQA